MAKGFIRLVAGILLAACLSGCASLTLQNTNELLRAPELGRQQGEIQKALAAALNEDPQYKYPKEGVERSPLLLADLNGDGQDEGIVLYSVQGTAAGVQDKGSNVYIAILEKKDGEWVLTQDQMGFGVDVARWDVADLLGDGTRQLLVGFAATNMSNKTFALYQYGEETLTEVYRSPYSRYELGDFTGQGGSDLVLVSSDESAGALQLLYLPTAGGVFEQPQTPAKLDSNFSSCSGIYASRDAEGGRLLVIDGYGPSDMLISQLVFFSGEHFYVVDDSLRGKSGRANPLLRSRDIDGDGIVEIPLRIGNGEIGTLAGDKRLEYVEWLDYIATPDGEVKQYGLVDSDRSIYVRFPDEWRGGVTVKDGDDAGEWMVEDNKTHQVLLRLEVITAGEPPVTALHVPGVSSAYLIPHTRLAEAELQSIQVTPLS